MAGCELIAIYQKIKPDFKCDKDCRGGGVECGADIKKIVSKKDVEYSVSVSNFATQNIPTVPRKDITASVS